MRRECHLPTSSEPPSRSNSNGRGSDDACRYEAPRSAHH
jgi:hypothetical protein